MATREDDFAAWISARQSRLFRTAYLICGDRHTAEDLVQTAAAKLYLAWDRVSARGEVDAYMRRIIVNEHNSLWRRPWKRREVAADQLPETAYADVPGDPLEADRLWAAVRDLPPRQRAVIVLRYYEDLSEAEIAAALDISPGTVKSQASRAIASLRGRLGTAFDLEETA
ncbi:RNA polymerase sigma-70 factor (sigma-E family) [Nocardioides daedukensis]|uniref:RNA polymerase sigma-70 factor (Sigma-E family) n=1 Tax=Nocardioides daedukensis TaxID=634462 RepID=A0A7Y9S4V7_9ACTN|nr:SigE family RNA polymerase sigma factor [Nocardioides daedukensis]NYG59450.1 RNA polymerase sigma-70 factor (sigma-E family) [Nocardioides daedukensis]